MCQPHLIQQVLSDLNLKKENVKVRTTPMSASRILHGHPKSERFDQSFNYRSIIGNLGYLDKGIRSDISYAPHQCTRFAAYPLKEHGESIIWLGRYIHTTMDKGMIYTPKKSQGLQVYIDANFTGNWTRDEIDNVDTARYRQGYIITYSGCPICWKSPFQVGISLSTTKADYCALLHALKEEIPMIEMFKEMGRNKIKMVTMNPRIYCEFYEDNSGALAIAKEHKYRPRTKHLNIKLHHFQQYVNNNEIDILPINTDDQPTDVFTKPLAEPLLIKHRKIIMGW